MSEQTEKTKSVVLITGAATGIGQATARLLSQQGFTVYGASRRGANVVAPTGVRLLPLDVRSQESVDSCVEQVLREAGRIDVLVNNAGYVIAGAAEEFTLDEAQAQLDTNFWGVVRLTNAVLPGMRARGGGHIVNVTSVGGLVGKPFWAFYVASKFAAEGYSESLRYEVRPFGINVSVVEPGGIKSEFWRAKQFAAAHIAAYDEARQRVYQVERELEQGAADPQLVAQRILSIIGQPAPRLRYRVGRDAGMIYGMRRVLPEPHFEAMIRRFFHLNGKAEHEPAALPSSAHQAA